MQHSNNGGAKLVGRSTGLQGGAGFVLKQSLVWKMPSNAKLRSESISNPTAAKEEKAPVGC